MSRRDDSFGPKIVEIGAILAICWQFEILIALPWTVSHISKINITAAGAVDRE